MGIFCFWVYAADMFDNLGISPFDRITVGDDAHIMRVEYSQFIHKVSGQTLPFCHSEGETV